MLMMVDEALDFVRDLSLRGFNLVRFCDLLEEEIRSLLLYRSLKDPEKVMRVEDLLAEALLKGSLADTEVVEIWVKEDKPYIKPVKKKEKLEAIFNQ